MDIKGNRFGGSFEVSASRGERDAILEAIVEVGLPGIDSNQSSTVVNRLTYATISAVSRKEKWDRQILEIVDTTLGTESKYADAQKLAARALLKSQTEVALASNPRL
jgi:hypothetical protein